MNTMQFGPTSPKSGPIGPCAQPKRAGKVRETLSAALMGALRGAFTGWHGGSKALASATERAPRTTRRYLTGERTMCAVDLLMVCLRCPHFVTELRDRLKHVGELGGMLDALRTKAIARARRAGGKLSSLRLRFRRRKAVA